MATAVVTSAMLRTCDVRFDAIEFTLSVRSFHVPATPFTLAWPPSFPSVPTSRATRVTSEANEPSCSTMPFTSRAVRRNSPLSGRPSTSSAIVCDRSPLATAPITRLISDVGWIRSATSVLTDSTQSAQEPTAPARVARCVMRPSLPTIVPMRSNSFAMRSLRSMMSLSVSATLPATPTASTGMRTVKSPRHTAASTRRS